MEHVAQTLRSLAKTDPDTEQRVRRILELRSIGFHAMQHGPEGLPLQSYFGELKTLSVPGWYPERLEARAAICLGGRIRPSAMMRALDELRTIRREAGEMEKFDAFEAKFRACLSKADFTAHGFDRISFGGVDHRPVWGRIGDHIARLQALNYDVFLNSGTLLGVVRDQRLIAHDDDVDLAVLLKADSYDGIAREWDALRANLAKNGALDTAPSDDPKIIRLAPEGAVSVDLFPGWVFDGRVFVYPHTFGELTLDDVLPLRPCKVTGNPIPAQPEKMLNLNYGEDWHTPNPYWTFPWREAKKRFWQFRAATGVPQAA